MENQTDVEREIWPSKDGKSSGLNSLLLGLVGAAIGGVVGYLLFGWIASQGFYALIIPGAALGFGFALGARRHRVGYGVLCAILALGLGLFSEWRNFPFNADESLGYFLTHLHQLKPMTWIMILIGCVFAFSLGQGRRH